VKNKIFKKNCLLICFANEKIGSGHISRSQILAKSLKEKGWNIFLFGPSSSQKNILNKFFFKKIIYVNTLNKKKILNLSKKYIQNLIVKHEIELVIIDSYFIDNKFQKKIKKKIILKISNKKNNSNCNFILDYSFLNNINKKKDYIITPKYLLGPKYSLVEKKIIKNSRVSNKILITFGGSNLLYETEAIIKIFQSCLPEFKLYISTTTVKYYNVLKKSLNKNVTILLSSSLSKIINSYKFSFVVSSMGHAMYELIANNYPSLFIKFFKNQNLNFNYFKNSNLLKCVNYKNKNFNEVLNLFLIKFKKNKNFFRISKYLTKKINYQGSNLITSILDNEYKKKFYDNLPVLSTNRLNLVPLSKKNYKILFNLRKEILKKDPIYFKNYQKYSKKVHHDWFKKYSSYNRIDYLIYEKKYKNFIGSLSFKEIDQEIHMGKYISNYKFVGKKYGYESSKKWIDFGINKLGFSEIYAVTHKKNIINTKLNIKLGFKIIKFNKSKDTKWLKMVYK
jgi:spore coat polysaccharide biosynthesis predicted glycosyltransferase SpsG/RimJ/RimL family protein N-acetyltransferase